MKWIFTFPERHPRIWHWYLVVCVTFNFLSLLLNTWERDPGHMLLPGVFLFILLWDLHHPFQDDGPDDPEEDDDPDFPTGDIVDKWLRNRLLIPR